MTKPERMSAEELERARALWDAVQNETRGIGIDGAGDLRLPKSHEDFERFCYRNWPRLLAHIAALEAELAEARARAERMANDFQNELAFERTQEREACAKEEEVFADFVLRHTWPERAKEHGYRVVYELILHHPFVAAIRARRGVMDWTLR